MEFRLICIWEEIRKNLFIFWIFIWLLNDNFYPYHVLQWLQIFWICLKIFVSCSDSKYVDAIVQDILNTAVVCFIPDKLACKSILRYWILKIKVDTNNEIFIKKNIMPIKRLIYLERLEDDSGCGWRPNHIKSVLFSFNGSIAHKIVFTNFFWFLLNIFSSFSSVRTDC